ncbi:MAG: HAMP domain-containing protein [Planctomycetes bacterium]|nr:HAMP domain-containing protein [Planctomycetota bacterium]
MVSRLRSLASSLELRLFVPLGATIALVLSFHALLGYWGARDEISRFVRADLERSTSLIRSATRDGMLLNRMDEVQSRIEQLGASQGFTGIRVYAKDGRIALSADATERGRVVAISAEACATCHTNGEVTGPNVLRFNNIALERGGHEAQRSLTVINNEPSCSATACHSPPGLQPVLGVLDVQMTMAPFDEAIARARLQLGWTTALLILASGLIAALFIRRLVHEPVARLREGTRRIAAGDLNTRIDVPGRTELATLAGAFNGMVADLRGARDELDRWSRTLEQKVEEKALALKQAQQQMNQVETMASLGKLSATVAHELNNPLSGILAYARLVRREIAEQPIEQRVREELEGYLALVDKECVRCGDIVKNLLLFARGRSVRPKATDINQIIDHGLKLLRHHLEMNKVQLETTLIEGDPTIVADQNQILQAVLALLMNAIEAMQGEHDRSAILGVHLTGDLERVEIRISDTGGGIPPELIPHIFKPFVTTKGEGSGVGLGLSVVYGVVHGHGGDISVQSQPGVGTTFTITLPRKPSMEVEPKVVTAAETAAKEIAT